MGQNKTIASLIVLALILLIPAHAEENTSAPANNTTLPEDIFQTVNTTHEQSPIDKTVEKIFFIGIILSPVSFLLSVMALWVALKNRRKTYIIKQHFNSAL